LFYEVIEKFYDIFPEINAFCIFYILIVIKALGVVLVELLIDVDTILLTLIPTFEIIEHWNY